MFYSISSIRNIAKSYTVSELKALCKAQNLNTSGTKNILIERLYPAENIKDAIKAVSDSAKSFTIEKLKTFCKARKLITTGTKIELIDRLYPVEDGDEMSIMRRVASMSSFASLKISCKYNSLPTTGTKAELIDRLYPSNAIMDIINQNINPNEIKWVVSSMDESTGGNLEKFNTFEEAEIFAENEIKNFTKNYGTLISKRKCIMGEGITKAMKYVESYKREFVTSDGEEINRIVESNVSIMAENIFNKIYPGLLDDEFEGSDDVY